MFANEREEAARRAPLYLRGRWLVFSLALLALSCSSAARPECRPGGAPLGSVCGFSNPEDVAWSRAHGALLVSEMALLGEEGGALAAWTPGGPAPWRVWPTAAAVVQAPVAGVGEKDCPAVDPRAFSPHGIVVGPDDRLYVVNHGGRESVEIFTLEGQGAEISASWSGCILLPEGTSGNDIAVAPDGEVLVANYMPELASFTGNLKTLFGMPTGDIIAWRDGSGWRHVPNTEASAPNGVEVDREGRMIFFAETGGRQIVRVRRSDGGARAEVGIDGALDNLAWSEGGRLLVASHDSIPAFLACAGGSTCRAPWSVWEINPNTLAVERILEHDGEVVGAVASAEEVGGRVYLSAVFGDRIGVWQRGEAAPGQESAR